MHAGGGPLGLFRGLHILSTHSLQTVQASIKLYSHSSCNIIIAPRAHHTGKRLSLIHISVGLTPREFDLLEQLLRNRGAALYRDALFERVWGGEMDPDTRTLDLHINRLRKKLGWHDKITTVYKVGYKLEKEEAGP